MQLHLYLPRYTFVLTSLSKATVSVYGSSIVNIELRRTRSLRGIIVPPL